MIMVSQAFKLMQELQLCMLSQYEATRSQEDPNSAWPECSKLIVRVELAGPRYR